MKHLVVAEPSTLPTVEMDVPLLVRILEIARENLKSDDELHVFVERILRATSERTPLTMADIGKIEIRPETAMPVLPNVGTSVRFTVGEDEPINIQGTLVAGPLPPPHGDPYLKSPYVVIKGDGRGIVYHHELRKVRRA